MSESVCVPTDCAGGLQYPWKDATRHPAQDFILGKFDPENPDPNHQDPKPGNLIGVQLDVSLDLTGELCWQNDGTNTITDDYEWLFLHSGETYPDKNHNSPDLDLGDQPIPLDFVRQFYIDQDLPPGTGELECDGTDPGEATEDLAYSHTATPVVILDPREVSNYVLSPGEPDTIKFRTELEGRTNTTLPLPWSAAADAYGMVEITITYTYCTNAPPVCVPDCVTTAEETPIPIYVLQNDSDVDGCIVCDSLTLESGPQNGLVEGPFGCTGCGDCSDCYFLYTPNAGCSSGSAFDTFTYTVCDDDEMCCGPTEVTVFVCPINEQPLVDPVPPVQVCEDTPTVIDVLDYARDPDDSDGCGCGLIVNDPGDPILEVDPPHPHAEVFFSTDLGRWAVRYTPEPDFCGEDSFSFRVRDTCLGFPTCEGQACTPAAQWSSPAQVPVCVCPVNDPPVAVDDSGIVCEDGSVDIPVLANDFDPDDANGCGCSLFGAQVTIIQEPSCAGGSVTVLPNNEIRFVPPPDFCGDCTFKYRVTDNCTGVGSCDAACAQLCPLIPASDEATVTVCVCPVNDPPVAVDDSGIVCEDGSFVDIPVLANDFDPDDVNGCGCSLFGAQVTITQEPSCPGGSVTVLPNNEIRFVPPPDFCGDCTFKYQVTDNCTGVGSCDADCAQLCPLVSASDEAMVTVCVCPVNDPPIAVPDDDEYVCEGQSVCIDVLSNDWDPDDTSGCGCGLVVDDPAFDPIQVTMQPDCGGVANSVFDGDLGRWVVCLTPGADVCNVYCTFEYTVTDHCNVVESCDPLECPSLCPLEPQTSDPAPARVYVCPVNEPPVAVNDNPGCINLEDCTTDLECNVIDVLPNDYDPDDADGCGCGLTITDPGFDPIQIVSPPDCGGTAYSQFDLALGRWVVCFIPSGTLPPGDCGYDCSFSYRIRDDCSGIPGECQDLCDLLEKYSEPADVQLYVCPVNESPVAEPDFVSADFDMPIAIDVLENDWDPDNADGCGYPFDKSSPSLTIIDWDASCGEPEVVEDPPGHYYVLFTPTPGFDGKECGFTYRIWDTPHPLPMSDCCEPMQRCSDDAVVTISQACPPPCREPASLLIYPEFNNLDGVVSVLTVTNTSRFESIDAKFEYVDMETCQAFDRREFLTENDKLTLVTNYHNPEHERGYVYVYAECVDGNDPVVFNHLIGSLMIVDGLEGLAYSVNPFCHKGIGLPGVYSSCGLLKTDLDDDGIRDLDELEYDPVADQMLVPRFLGQTEQFQSELILIAMSGGSKFDTTVGLTIYNDNQEFFSREYEFYCWAREPLLDISQVFGRTFLRTTTHDPREILGQEEEEAGWFRVDGVSAISTQHTIIDPAIYAVLVESVGEDRYVADLPFEFWCQDNGKLLPSDLHGGEEP